MKVAHVSTFPPLRCGIARFASDVIAALPLAENSCYALAYGDGLEQAGQAVTNVNSVTALAALGDVISSSDCDLVCLQHEFGIWGGPDGEHMLEFLARLKKPLVSVLHTTLPSVDGQGLRRASILKELVRASTRVIVLTARSLASLSRLIGHPVRHAHVVPHGVAPVDYVSPAPCFPSGGAHPPRLVTLGFFRESKGFECCLTAVWLLKRRGIIIEYRIAGEPQAQFGPQRRYLVEIAGLVAALGLESQVTLDVRYLTPGEQVAAIQASHAGLFAYQDPSQASSGAIPLVLSAGRPVICTPFEYASDRHADVPGILLAADFGPWAVASAVERFLGADGHRERAKEVYERTRAWEWENVGRAINGIFHAALEEQRL